MKIAIIHRNGFELIGGVEGTIYNIAKTLNEMSHEVVVISCMNDHAKQETEVTDFCKIRRFPQYKTNKLTSIFTPYFIYKNSFKGLKHIIQEENPDVIISRDNILTLSISKFFDIEKLLYIPLGVIQYYNSGIRKFSGAKGFILELIRFFQLKCETKYQNKSFKRLKNIVVFSENMKTQIASVIGKSEHINVVYPGVADNELYRVEYDYSVHDELGIDHGKKIFLFVGRVVQEKNVRMLVEAFSNVKNDNLILCIVGGGDDLENVKNISADLGITNRVYFLGYRRDTERFYQAADYLILPSYYESFGNVVPEAFIAGTPVVGFKTIPGKTLTALDELIEDDRLGVLCNEYSTNTLADALNGAYSHCMSERFLADKQYCREHALRKFNWCSFLKKILS